MQKGTSRHAVLAGFLGWTLDAFDFFVVVFLLDILAAQFAVPKKQIILTLTFTLAFRPVGAVIFGILADRFGRRGPLMANVIYFSVIELLSGFAQTYTQFLTLYIRAKVPESEAWREHRVGTMREIGKELRGHARGFAYVVLLMTFMMFLSHGTQDLYPDFLKHEHHVAATTVPWIAITYNIGAVVGAVIFGHLSQHIGRRYSMITALTLSICVMPFWAFGSTLLILAVGAFFMQAGVQGAWGIIPVHLNELSPDRVRGLVPGLGYQLGILIAAPTNTIEDALRERFGYSWALAGFEIFVIVSLTIILLLGREQRGRSFYSGDLAIERD
ncbi:MAG TPA: MFS transporter [Thermoanaerobaculia bacterium]|jgi:MFS family permease|nr:MFS transporter [Thermoanaerobaculia bacterium]